jgi:hypothetical protein
MRMTVIALATFATVLTVAPDAFGAGLFGGSRGRSHGSNSGAFAGTGAGTAAVAQTTHGGGTATASTSEPLVALAVGLGLLGARYLRRR